MAVYYAYECDVGSLQTVFAFPAVQDGVVFWETQSDVRIGYETSFPVIVIPGPEPASIPTIVGELNTGEDVTITLYDSNMNSVPLDDDNCTEKDATGFFSWASSNMTTFPTEATIYFWVMEDTLGRRDYGNVEIGDRPVPELGSVWDALTADHTGAGSFGERVDAVPTATEIRQEIDGNSIQLASIIEDTGTDIPAALATIDANVDAILIDTGTDIPASLAIIDHVVDEILVDTGTTIPASLATIDNNVDEILIDTETTLPASLTILEDKVDFLQDTATDIYTDTQRVDGLIEDSGGDRFTAKALEEAPGTSSGDIETACGNALTTYDAATGADVTAVENKVDDVYVDTQRVDGLIEDSGGDRFTEKALEEAPTGGSAPTVEEIRAEMDSNSTQLAAIVDDTGTTLPATLTTIEGKIDALEGGGGSGATAEAIRQEMDTNSEKLIAIKGDTEVLVNAIVPAKPTPWPVR